MEVVSFKNSYFYEESSTLFLNTHLSCVCVEYLLTYLLNIGL